MQHSYFLVSNWTKEKKIHEIDNDENWINVMLEELNKFKRNELQELDYGPYNQSTVGTN